jgi:hypothetical protein
MSGLKYSNLHQPSHHQGQKNTDHEHETIFRSLPESHDENLSFPNIVKVHQMVMKFKNKIQHSRLSTTELAAARVNFEYLKFADYEDSVYYNVLGRDMHRLRVFATLDSAISFCEHLIPGSKLISFDDLLKAYRCEETRDVMAAYLRRLAADGDCSLEPISNSKILTLPSFHSSEATACQKTNRLFTQKLFGTQARLYLNSNQKQTIVRQDSDHLNLSIPARPRIFTLTDNSQKREVSISSRRYEIQRSGSGFSYREADGGRFKSSGIKIINHATT